MREKPWNEKTLDERYAHEEGSFNWCIDRVDVGDPEISRLIRVVCRDQTVWPEQLLGRRGAGVAVSPRSYPASTGPCPEPLIGSRFAFARRLIWRGAYEVTDHSVENIAAMVGGYSPSTVRPWATSWRLFEKRDPIWWRYWGSKFIDLVGCEMPPEYLVEQPE